MKILIAEDDFTSRLLLQGFLKNYGTSHVAVNGKEAVDAVRASLEADEPYDLICLDIMMPEMDGQEALRQIRKLEEAKGILSTHGACDSYLTKPIRKVDLLDKMRDLKLIE